MYQERIPIGQDETIGDIHDKLMIIGATLVLKTIDALAEGSVSPIPQELKAVDPQRLHAPKIFKDHCKIDWNKPVKEIKNLIRGLSPYPAAWTIFNRAGFEISAKIFKADAEEIPHNCQPGEILSDNKKYLKIAGLDGFLYITDLQIAGKKRMGIAEFLRGFSNIADYKAE